MACKKWRMEASDVRLPALSRSFRCWHLPDVGFAKQGSTQDGLDATDAGSPDLSTSFVAVVLQLPLPHVLAHETARMS